MGRIRTAVALAAFAVIVGCGTSRIAEPEMQAPRKLQSPASGAANHGPDLAAVAAAAWKRRGERAELTKAIASWNALADRRPHDASIYTHLARAYLLLGDGFLRLQGDQDATLAAYEKGVVAGGQALMAVSPVFAKQVQQGQKVEDAVAAVGVSGEAAMYWYAANLGRFAMGKGLTTQLSYKDRITAVMRRVLALNENFFYAAPHRYFGAYYAKAPALAGGDVKKSKQHFERALALDPTFFANKVLYAEYYAVKVGDRDLFTRLLSDVVAADPTVLPDVIPEQKIAQAKARALLGRVDELF